MLKSRSFNGIDPTAAADEHRHELELAQGVGGPRLVAEACGASLSPQAPYDAHERLAWRVAE